MTTQPHTTRYISQAEMAAAIEAARTARAQVIAAGFSAIRRGLVRLWQELARWLPRRLDDAPPISP
jgi:hypothetical protein